MQCVYVGLSHNADKTVVKYSVEHRIIKLILDSRLEYKKQS